MIELRSSYLRFYGCKQAFILAQQHQIKQTKAMKEGALFEGYVFGFKDDVDEMELYTGDGGKPQRKETIASTMARLKSFAERVAKLFVLKDAIAYERMTHKQGNWNLTGELDFVGNVLFDGKWTRCIADLKHTGDMVTIWGAKTEKLDYLQAFIYTYLWYKKHGELLPFIYVVCEEKDGGELIRTIRLDLNEDDFKWLEALCDDCAMRIFFEPNPAKCTGPRFGVRCQFWKKCGFFKGQYEAPVMLMGSMLHDPIHIAKEITPGEFETVTPRHKDSGYGASDVNIDDLEEGDIPDG